MRPTSEQVLMLVAQAMAFRSTCSRLNVGAVVAVDGRILSTGYNGAPAGLPHCDHKPTRILTELTAYPVEPDIACTTAMHAEANAIAFAAKHGVSVKGATLFTTHSPCQTCAYLLINSGIGEVVYREQYRDANPLSMLFEAKVNVIYQNDVKLLEEHMPW